MGTYTIVPTTFNVIVQRRAMLRATVAVYLVTKAVAERMSGSDRCNTEAEQEAAAMKLGALCGRTAVQTMAEQKQH